MNVIEFGKNISSTGTFPTAGVFVDSFDGRNTNNTGLVQCFQKSPGAGASSIAAVVFTVQGSVDGTNWGTVLPTTTATAPTTTADGGTIKAISLAPYMRILVTTAPSAIGGNPTTASFSLAW